MVFVEQIGFSFNCLYLCSPEYRFVLFHSILHNLWYFRIRSGKVCCVRGEASKNQFKCTCAMAIANHNRTISLAYTYLHAYELWFAGQLSTIPYVVIPCTNIVYRWALCVSELYMGNLWRIYGHLCVRGGRKSN